MRWMLNGRDENGDRDPGPLADALTAREAATTLHLSERTIRRAIHRGDLTATKWGGVFRISPEDLARFSRARCAEEPLVSMPTSLNLVERDPSAFQVPSPLTPLIGRERDVALLVDLLRRSNETRLIVLTGPGGVGKTRLALAIASTAGKLFADGVTFVSLASIRDSALVMPTVAKSLGIREDGERSLADALVAVLKSEHRLLIVDNVEQVAEASPELGMLLEACPRLVLLATSRARLRLSGEHIVPIQPLQVETPREHPGKNADHLSLSPAVQLFEARAQAVQPDFKIGDDNASAVTDVCRRLDGLPLAIELAAARISTLTPAAMLTRLDRCLPLLTDGPRDRPLRQQTMRNTVAWSYDLLTPEEQSVFRSLSVFTGGFALDAAEAVAGEQIGGSPSTISLVASLVDKSLLRRVGELALEPRLSMLETVREFGWEQLSEQRELDGVRQHHSEYFLALAEGSERKLRSRELGQELAQLEAEHNNLRAALAWSLEDPSRMDTALRLTGALHWFWYLRDYYGEGRRWIEEALDRATAERPTVQRAKALAGAGLLAIHPARDYDAARTWFEQSVALGRALEDPASLAYALHFLAWAELLQRDPDEIRSSLEECIALFRQTGDRWGVASALCTLGMALIIEHETEAASKALQESLSLSRDVGDPWCIARSLHYAGEVARFSGKADEARQLYEESIALYRTLDHRGSVAIVMHNLGYVAQDQADLPRAMACFTAALADHVALGDQQNIGHCLGGIAGTAALQGRLVQAARLFAAADAHFEHLGTSIWPVDRVHVERNRQVARYRLGATAFADAYAAGHRLSVAEAVSEALVIAGSLDDVDGAFADQSDVVALPFALTPREIDVLRLLANHATDREIAEELSVSPRTVMHHVSNLLAKLGVTHRRAAAATAARYGLI